MTASSSSFRKHNSDVVSVFFAWCCFCFVWSLFSISDADAYDSQNYPPHDDYEDELWINLPAVVSQFNFHIDSTSMFEKCNNNELALALAIAEGGDVDPFTSPPPPPSTPTYTTTNDESLHLENNDDENEAFSDQLFFIKKSQNELTEDLNQTDESSSFPESSFPESSSTNPCSCLKSATTNRPFYPIQCGELSISAFF